MLTIRWINWKKEIDRRIKINNYQNWLVEGEPSKKYQ